MQLYSAPHGVIPDTGYDPDPPAAGRGIGIGIFSLHLSYWYSAGPMYPARRPMLSDRLIAL